MDILSKEDAALLAQDICARLPYGVTIQRQTEKKKEFVLSLETNGDRLTSVLKHLYTGNYKPVLRPMSSMNLKERIIFLEQRGREIRQYGLEEDVMSFPLEGANGFDTGIYCRLGNYARHINWLNEKGFDYRGLIKKGLAIDKTAKYEPLTEEIKKGLTIDKTVKYKPFIEEKEIKYEN